jgi:hypothetical protein
VKFHFTASVPRTSLGLVEVCIELLATGRVLAERARLLRAQQAIERIRVRTVHVGPREDRDSPIHIQRADSERRSSIAVAIAPLVK